HQPGWHTNYYPAFWNICNNYSVGTYDSSITNVDISDYLGPSIYDHIVSNFWIKTINTFSHPSRSNRNPLVNNNALSNLNPIANNSAQKVVTLKVLSDLGLRRPIATKSTVNFSPIYDGNDST